MVAALPEAVRKQAERAKGLQTKLAEGAPLDLGEGAEEEPREEDQTDVQEVELQPEDRQPQGDWEHKFKSLQGKLNQANTTIRSLNSTVDNLNQIILQLNEKKPEPPVVEPGKDDPVTATYLLNEDDFEGYGDEMVDMVKLVNDLKRKNDAQEKENAALRAEIASTKGEVQTVGETVTKSAFERFRSAVMGRVPNIEAINEMQEWLQWLGQVDTMSGVVRQQLLDDAWDAMDVDRVVKIIEAFCRESGVKIGKGKRSANASLEDQIEPDLSGGGDTPPGSGNLKPVSREEYAQAGKDRSQGKMTPEAYADITKRFLRTIKEGKA